MAFFEKTKITDASGNLITSENPFTTSESGELLEAIQALRMAIQSLNRSVGQSLPDSNNRTRVNIETGNNITITALPTLANVTTVATVTTVTGQTNIGGFAAADQIPSLMSISAQGLRRNITVT